jgi:peptidoglycan/LPS O-acetylase OafA/YrhL
VRISGLDSIRGIASLVVLLMHAMLLSIPESTIYYRPKLRIIQAYLLNGNLAVITFFVLSGCVLALSILHEKGIFSYLSYVLRRVARLWIPFAVAFLGAVLILSILQKIGGPINESFDWALPSTAWGYITALFMVGVGHDDLVNPPIWTLFVEMHVSLLIPFIVRRNKRSMLILTVVGILISNVCGIVYSKVDGGNFRTSIDVIGRILLSIYYIQFFVIGVSIAVFRNEIRSYFQKLGKYTLILISISLLLFMSSYWFAVAELKDAGYMIFSAVVVMYCVSFDRLNRLLSHSLFAYLGRISFSLYLVHLPILASACHLLRPYIGVYASIVLGCIAVFPVAHIFNLFVEGPAISVGRYLARRFKHQKQPA